jgi:hypothetical protein
MPYTAAKPPLPETREELQARIPGWGVDLDPDDRPSGRRERLDPRLAPSTIPESQPERRPRERSIEHAKLTPVFGTSCPPRGLSGAIRWRAYRYSEARAAHWLLLLGADRVDALGSHLRSFVTLHPDNPITQTGVRSELTHHGFRSRFGRRRADLAHQAFDPVVVAGPWLIGGLLVFRTAQRLRDRISGRTSRA